MGATPLLDDGVSVTYQLDDGSTVKVAKDAAARIGAPMPMAPPQQIGMGNAPIGGPPQMGAPSIAAGVSGSPSAAPSMVTPAPSVTDGYVRSGENPGDQQGYGFHAGAPVQNGADYPAQLTASMQPPPAAKPGRTPAAAKQPAAAPAAPARFGDVTRAGDEAEQMQSQAIDDRTIAEQAANQTIANTLLERNANMEAIRQKQEADQARSLAEIERRGVAVDAAMQDYSKTKIDPSRLSKSLSGAGKAGLIFFQVLAGLGQALKHKGGENPAVDMWLKQQADDVRLQMDARDQKRDMIGQQKDALGRFKDLAQTRAGTFNLAMAAETDRAAKTLEQVAAQTKSDLVRANALEAHGLLKQQSANFKGEWAKAEYQADLQAKQLQEQIRSAKVNEGIAGGHLALAQKTFTEGTRRWDLEYAQRERMHNDDLAEKIALAKSSGKTAEAKQLEEERKFSVGAPTAVAKDKAGNVVRNEDGTPQVVRESLKNKDGSAWLARNEAQADEFGNKIAVAGEVNDIISEVQAIREEVGAGKLAVTKFSPIPTDAKARLDVLQNRLVVLAKSGTQGMSSDEDMKKLSATLGATDLASFTTNAAALNEAKARTISQLNREARNRYNYTGDPITFEDVQRLGANPADAAYEAAAKGKTREQLGEEATPGKARRAAEYLTGGGMFYKSAGEKAEEAASGEKTSPYGITPDAQKGVDELTNQLRSRDRGTAANAAQKIIALAKDHPDLAPAIAATVRDKAPETWGVMQSKLPSIPSATVPGAQPLNDFAAVTDFAPADVARQAMADNAEGRRMAKLVMDASKSPDPRVRKAAAEVLQAARTPKGP